MNTILICLVITVSIVLIWDYFNFPYEVTAQAASWILHRKVSPDEIVLPKPLGCSTCMSFWCTLGVFLALDWKLAYLSLVFAFLVPHIYATINLLSKAIHLVLYSLDMLLNRLKMRLE